MAISILDLTAEIVIAHASVTEMTSEDLLKELKMVFATLQALEKGERPVTIKASAQELMKRSNKTQEPAELVFEAMEEKPIILSEPALSFLEAFRPDHVGCMICGKTGMKTLKRHLGTAHNLKPGQYRKQFNIPKDQPLAATEYVEKRRQSALDRGLGEKLVAARAAQKAKQATE